MWNPFRKKPKTRLACEFVSIITDISDDTIGLTVCGADKLENDKRVPLVVWEARDKDTTYNIGSPRYVKLEVDWC